MSIFNKCEKYTALPYFGFPVIPTVFIKENKIYLKFNFPEGYKPNGNKIKEPLDRLMKKVGKRIIEQNENDFTIECEPELLAYVIYKKAF